jgi:hypothetical protein
VGWQQYAALVRELDLLRLERERLERARSERDEAETAARRAGTGSGPGSGVTALRAELVRVEAALDDQADQLQRLARLLRLRGPALAAAPDPPSPSPAGGAPATPTGDPFALLEQAVGQAQRSADLANEAERRARRPRLLPALATGPRNLVVYLSTALLGLAVQYPIVDAHPNDAPFALVLVLVPALTFGLGWLLITLFGRSRLVSAAERARVGAVAGSDPRRRSARLGLTVCFLAFPAAFLVLLVAGALRR